MIPLYLKDFKGKKKNSQSIFSHLSKSHVKKTIHQTLWCFKLSTLLTDKKECSFVTKTISLLANCSHFLRTKTNGNSLREVALL